ncbi:methyltransferase domain-containing protein [Candidatus Dojkabacteria bacterium]|nr:methyltransferase domain-containing protein [Candidatus Dojkabacteria bacterium]
MANTRKKTINTDSYKRVVEENKVLDEILEKLKNKYDFPVDNLLEVGTGLGNFLTKFLVDSERTKDIGKFYAMEPVDEFFEESKRHVVRLSRTDAVTQEFFGGNPFDVITFSMVYNHIKPDQKKKFLKNIKNNFKDEGKLVVFDMFLPEYDDEDHKKEIEKEFLRAHIDYFKNHEGEYLMNYFTNVLKGVHEDFWVGKYKTSLKDFTKMLKKVGFENIEVEHHKGEGKADWEKMGYHIITAEKK